MVAATAPAATVHQPAPGASFRQDEAVLFDWAWDSDEYWTPRIIFTQVANGNDPIWFGGDVPGKIRATDNYGSGWGESHATIDFSHYPFTPGQWYWRLCNSTVNGEDDKCYQRGDPIPITITPKPDPPPAPAAPPAPASAPAAPGRPPVAPTPTRTPTPTSSRPARLPTLAVDDAKGHVRTALRRRFGTYRNASGKRVAGCARLSRVRIRCSKVSWFIGDLSYGGRVTIWLAREGGETSWNYGYRITRFDEYCAVRGGRRCTKTYRVE